MEIALTALEATDVEVLVAALGVLRSWVPQESGTRLLEAITAIAVDRSRDARIRVAALDALSDLPDDLVRPIREQAPPPEAAGPPLDNPVAARDWIEAHGDKSHAGHTARRDQGVSGLGGPGGHEPGARGVDEGARRGSPNPGRREAAASPCTTRGKPSAARSLRCRQDSSKRYDVSATPVAWSHSRAPGRRHERPPGVRNSLRRRERL